MDEATIRVPATTANLGPGYDCLGVALRLYNEVTVRRSRNGSKHPDIVRDAGEALFTELGRTPFPFTWKIVGDVPQSRGLGSSVTVRLGVLMGLNAILGSPLLRFDLFRLCSQLEGHPDNAAPAVFGGFTVASGETKPQRFPVGDLHFVLLIPDFEVATKDARRVLPERIAHSQAVQSSANACRLTAAMASQDYGQLRGCFEDGLHQPFRQSLIPFLDNVIEAGEEAGALGGFLSGSGSTIACVTLRNPEAVGAAMAKAAPVKSNPTIRIVLADNQGAKRIRSSAEG